MTTTKKLKADQPTNGKFSNPFDMFKTDKTKETEGIVLNYSDVFWVQITRAGGSNEHYKKILADKLKPHRRAIQTETIDENASTRLLREAVAEGLLVNWGTGIYPNGAGYIPNKAGGEPIAFSVDNAVALFEELPDLFADIYEQANKQALFRSNEAEADAGNSARS